MGGRSVRLMIDVRMEASPTFLWLQALAGWLAVVAALGVGREGTSRQVVVENAGTASVSAVARGH